MNKIKRVSEVIKEHELLNDISFINSVKHALKNESLEFEYNDHLYSFVYESSLNIGDRYKHPLFKDMAGEIEIGPDTIKNISKKDYNIPEDDELRDANIPLSDKNKKVWYGVKTDDGYNLCVHTNDIVNESYKHAFLNLNDLSERRKVEVKRVYTELYPAIEVGKWAPVRSKILKFVSENGGYISRTELLEYINGMNEDIGSKTSMGWVRQNYRYIRETVLKGGERGYKLTKLGKRVVNKITINE